MVCRQANAALLKMLALIVMMSIDVSIFFFLTLSDVWRSGLHLYHVMQVFHSFSFVDKSQIKFLKIHFHMLSFVTKIRIFEVGIQTLGFLKLPR